jgi:hypothetical protein
MAEDRIEFYKWDKLTPLHFELVDAEVTEDYKVWDNKNRRVLWRNDEILPDGTTLEDSKYIRKMDWIEKFKDDYRKMIGHNYNISVNDIQYRIGFTTSVHNAIQEKLDTIKSMGSDYSKVKFVVESNGKPGLERRYTVKTESKESVIDTDKAQEVQLTEQEKKLVEGAKSIGNVNENAFVQFAKAQISEMTEDRARQVYGAFF